MVPKEVVSPTVEESEVMPKPTPTPTPKPASIPSTPCVDEAPDAEYTCAEQAAYGRCSSPFMEGFCLVTCGTCQ